MYHAACRWPEIPCEYQLLQLAPSGALEEMFIAEFQEVNLWILMVSICFAEGFTNKNYEYMVSICGPASAGGSVCVFLMWHVVNRDLGWYEEPGLAHEIWQFKIAGI